MNINNSNIHPYLYFLIQFQNLQSAINNYYISNYIRWNIEQNLLLTYSILYFLNNSNTSQISSNTLNLGNNIRNNSGQNENKDNIVNEDKKTKIIFKEKPKVNKIISKPKQPQKSKNQLKCLGKKKRRTTKLCTACPHKNAVHYAKNMCSNCYHSRGRNKKPWNCSHFTKSHYALGLCQNCYQMKYIQRQVSNDLENLLRNKEIKLLNKTTSSNIDNN